MALFLSHQKGIAQTIVLAWYLGVKLELGVFTLKKISGNLQTILKIGFGVAIILSHSLFTL